MTRYLLLLLFVGTMGSRALGLDFGLGPGLSLKNALLYAAFTVIAIESAVAGNRKIEMLPVILPYLLLIIYAFITWLIIVVFLENPYYAAGSTLIRLKGKLVDQYLMLLVFFFGVLNWKDALWLLKALVWVYVAGCLITVVDSFNVPDLGIITTRWVDGRVEGIIGSAQDFGALCGFFLPAIVAVWWTESGLKKMIALVGIGLVLVSLILAASRGAIFGVIAGGLVSAVYLRRHISGQMMVRATMAMLFFSAIAILFVLSTDFGSLIQTRMTTGLESGDLETLSSGRTQIWSAALREMADHPVSFVTGLGWESYYETSGHRYSTHSAYLDRFYNLGTIGLSLFVLSYINAATIIRRGVQGTPAEALPFLIATMIGIVSFIIAMTFNEAANAATYVWAVVGLALRIVVAGAADANRDLAGQALERGWSRDHAIPTIRPTSATPRR